MDGAAGSAVSSWIRLLAAAGDQPVRSEEWQAREALVASLRAAAQPAGQRRHHRQADLLAWCDAGGVQVAVSDHQRVPVEWVGHARLVDEQQTARREHRIPSPSASRIALCEPREERSVSWSTTVKLSSGKGRWRASPASISAPGTARLAAATRSGWMSIPWSLSGRTPASTSARRHQPVPQPASRIAPVPAISGPASLSRCASSSPLIATLPGLSAAQARCLRRLPAYLEYTRLTAPR